MTNIAQLQKKDKQDTQTYGVVKVPPKRVIREQKEKQQIAR